AVVGHEEGTALDREDDQRPLVRVEVMGKEGEPIRIAFCRTSKAEERSVVEGIRVAHRCGEGLAEDERSRETGTLKRTAFMVPPAVSPTKLDEAKAALERGAFEEALRLIEVANSETPDDTETRELYAVTHLAKAIRLSEEARKARQAAFAIRKIERPCERCGDTGFCPHCKGRGHRQFLGLDRKCERCYGRGICPACGVL